MSNVNELKNLIRWAELEGDCDSMSGILTLFNKATSYKVFSTKDINIDPPYALNPQSNELMLQCVRGLKKYHSTDESIVEVIRYSRVRLVHAYIEALLWWAARVTNFEKNGMPEVGARWRKQIDAPWPTWDWSDADDLSDNPWKMIGFGDSAVDIMFGSYRESDKYSLLEIMYGIAFGWLMAADKDRHHSEQVNLLLEVAAAFRIIGNLEGAEWEREELEQGDAVSSAKRHLAKKGSDATHANNRKLKAVAIEYYVTNKSKYSNKNLAATEISSIVNKEYETVRKWLRNI